MTSTRKRDTQNFQKHPKRLLAVTSKQPENKDVFNSLRLSAGIKTYAGDIQSNEKKKSYIIGHQNI